MSMQKIGEYAFLVGALIAVVAGMAASWVTGGAAGAISALLVVLGIIVGLLNITEKETTPFLVAAIALVVAGTAGFGAINQIVQGLGTIIDQIVGNLAIFVAPAAVIVALKAVYALASSK